MAKEPIQTSSTDRDLTKPKPPEVKGNPPKPNELDLNPARYAQLTPADKVAYHQAKLAYAQAYAQYDAAERAARETYGKPFDYFVAARTDYDKADEAVTSAIRAAKAKLDKIGSLAEALKPNELIKPEQAKAQIDQLAAAVDDYKKAGDAVAAALATREKARAVLAPLAQPGDRGLGVPNKAAQDLAEDQYALELAQAQVAVEAAYDAYMVKKAEIVGHLPFSAEAA